MLFSHPHFASLSLAPSLCHFLFITSTLSVSSVFSIFISRCPHIFLYSGKEPNWIFFFLMNSTEIVKLTNLKLSRKTSPSYVHLESHYLTLCSCISYLIFLPLSLVLFISLSLSLLLSLLLSLSLSYVLHIRTFPNFPLF